MSALQKEKGYTHQDYIAKKGRWELINGLFYDMAPAPYPMHQITIKKIVFEIEKSFNCKEKCEVYISPIDWKLNEKTVVQPDIAIFCEKTDKQYFSLTPPFIVEVLSKATAGKDLQIKYKLYEKAGVKYYVIVEPNTQFADIFELVDGKYELRLKALFNDKYEFRFDDCGFTLDFGNVFEEVEEED